MFRMLYQNCPGISQLTTGPAISKPVIRGLYGNRVLAVLSGLKFDNQQWQDEHGLGLNDVGIDRIEVIKGPGITAVRVGGYRRHLEYY